MYFHFFFLFFLWGFLGAGENGDETERFGGNRSGNGGESSGYGGEWGR